MGFLSAGGVLFLDLIGACMVVLSLFIKLFAYDFSVLMCAMYIPTKQYI